MTIRKVSQGGRRLEENLFIVRYKAFDSVDRVALIRALMYYKCDP